MPSPRLAHTAASADFAAPAPATLNMHAVPVRRGPICVYVSYQRGGRQVDPANRTASFHGRRVPPIAALLLQLPLWRTVAVQRSSPHGPKMCAFALLGPVESGSCRLLTVFARSAWNLLVPAGNLAQPGGQ